MYLKRIFICFILIITIHVYYPKLGFSQTSRSDSNTQVTVHEPKAHKSKEKDIQVKKGGNWLWVLLGAAVVAGGVAAVGSGGSSGDSGGGDGGTSTGEYEFTW